LFLFWFFALILFLKHGNVSFTLSYCPPAVYTNRWPLIAASSVPLHLFVATYCSDFFLDDTVWTFFSESQMVRYFYTTSSIHWYSIVCTSGTVKTSSILWRIVTLRKLLLRKFWYRRFLYFYLQVILYLMLIFIPSWILPRISLWTMKLIHLLPCSVLRYYNGTFWLQTCSSITSSVSPLFRNIIRCCYIMVDFATAASQNGFSATSFPFIRKPMLFRKWQKH
jgi:hypothetical protein